MHIIDNLILVWGLWTLQSAIEERNFLNVCAGVFLLALVFGFVVEDASKTGTQRESFRMDGSFYIVFAGLVAARTAFYHAPFNFHVLFRCASFVIAGLALILLSPRVSVKQVVFTKAPSAKGSRAVRLPESIARLGLFAGCLTIAAIVTVLLVKDDKVRLACFLTTMIVGLVVTRVLPLKALKWVLSSMSLGKLKADD